jgi:F-type H+-transporting ATPase subunit a
MDFLPVDIMGLFYEHVLLLHNWRGVPTADINTTFALSLSVWLLMIYFSIAVKGLGGFVHELLCSPFGVKPLALSPLLIIFNLLFNLVELISKPIIFLLVWLLAATGLVGSLAAVILGSVWAVFHILIVGLQAYIFMMLTIVYIAMAHETH